MVRTMKLLVSAILVSSLFACGGRGHRGTMRAERANDMHDAKVEAMTGWDKLGERWIEGGVDHDVIEVGRDDGRFRVIKLKAEHSALEMFNIVVIFGDGSKFSPDTRLVFDQGEWSRDIDLPGGDRVIKRVEFSYGNLPGGGKAQLELWGR